MNEKLYKLIPICEARKNLDGTYTTNEIINAKYPGGSNQVEVKIIIFDGKEYKIITKVF